MLVCVSESACVKPGNTKVGVCISEELSMRGGDRWKDLTFSNMRRESDDKELMTKII